MITFKELGLNSEIMKSLEELGFVEPTLVQVKTIPYILNSKADLVALAQTGTGKTAAFSLPILNQIKKNEKELQTIILCPTRELSLQITQDIKNFIKHSPGISVTAVYGGERIDLQMKALRRGTNIVVGTPGRVLDLIKRKSLKLQNIKWLVLDEADEMLDIGFKDDLDKILNETPATKRTLLFLATMSKNVRVIAKNYMNSAEEISVGEKNIGAENVSHEYYIASHRERFEALKRILDFLPGVYGILFCRTRNETQEVAEKLKRAGYDTEALHGEISQSIRTKIMQGFKNKKSGLLVATDVAARGIDVSDLSHVINYNLPDQDEGYTHRSGRTGRAQKSGISISIISPRETSRIKDLERIIGKSFEHKQIPNGEDVIQKQIDNFIQEIEATDITKNTNEKYFDEITNRLKKINKEDLIKHFIIHKFNHLMDDNKNTRDLNARADFSEIKRKSMGEEVSLEINLGKKHRFGVKDLFTLINSNRNLKGIEIGTIELGLENSIFSVEKRRSDELIKNLKGKSFGDKKINIIKSNKKPSYSNNRLSRPKRNFDRKKRRR